MSANSQEEMKMERNDEMENNDLREATSNENDTDNQNQPRIKKDELWKRLLRPFRQFLQKTFADEVGAKNKQKWSEDKIFAKLQSFSNLLQMKV